jgi:hypothetical protein
MWVPNFALVVTNNSASSRWQIHRFDCPDVRFLVRKGAFVHYPPADSPERLRDAELAAFPKPGQTADDCKIMSCCGENPKQTL